MNSRVNDQTTSGISVLTAAYNAESTIEATLASAMRQSRPPDEIVVLDDGSTDRTAAIVAGFGAPVVLHRQANAGVATARNVLLRLARNDWVAFLDSDDLWHPRYLEQQCRAMARFPEAVAYYTGFESIGAVDAWEPDPEQMPDDSVQLIEAKTVLQRYQEASGFLLPSFSVISRGALLNKLGENPFPANISTAEDAYMWYALALSGPFVESSARLGAYRLSAGSLSSNRLRAYRQRTVALEHLVTLHEQIAPSDMRSIAADALSSTYRQYAKHLMGAGDTGEARGVLKRAWGVQRDWRTLAVLASTYFPTRFQPHWPGIDREHA